MTTTVLAPLGVVAHYNLLERLEPAGPGELYRARDTRLGRTVAVRLLPADFASGKDRTALLEQARAIRSLSHPNVTTLFDVGEQDGRVYLVFEFLKGRSLRLEMGGRMMNVRRAVEIAVGVADAIADAHAAGFAHGGLSPDTVVVTVRGQVKVPAFDLATREGFDTANGTIRLRDYESPEEARGEAPDDRSDVYSVGAVLYEMLTGRRPLHRGAAAPSATNPRVPAELDRLVLAAVAPRPDQRPASAAALAADLRAVGAALDRDGAAGDEPEEQRPARAQSGRLAGLAVVLLIAIVLVLWLWVL